MEASTHNNNNKPKVAISLHVCSMKQSAQLVTGLLHNIELDVCFDPSSSGGTEYIEDVEKNLQKADIVILLLNKHWAKSDQFKQEFTVVQQRVNRKQTVLITVAFTEIEWHPSLTTSADLICHNAENLLSGHVDTTLQLVKDAVLRVISPSTSSSSSSSSSSSPKMKNAAITSPKMKNAAVTSPKMKNAVIRSSPKIKNEAITSPKINDSVIYSDDLRYSTTSSTSNNLSNSAALRLDKQGAAQLYESVFGAAQPHAICRLAQCYLNGTGVIEKDVKKAIRLYEKAATFGSVSGAYSLATLYEKGTVTQQDLDRAEVLYAKAAAGGNLKAKKRLQKVIAKKNNILDDRSSRKIENIDKMCCDLYVNSCIR